MSTASQSQQLKTSSNIAEKENQAHEFVRKHIWSEALTLYDQILEETRKNDAGATTETFAKSGQNSLTSDQTIICFLGRYECLFELLKYDRCVIEGKNILAVLSEKGLECGATIARVRRRLVYALCRLKNYTEAEDVLNDWIQEISLQPSFNDISKTLERYKTHVKYANGSLVFNNKATISSHSEITEIIDAEIIKIDTKLEHWATNNLPLDKYSKHLTLKSVKNNSNNICNSNNNINNSNSININNNHNINNNIKQQQRGDNNGNSSTNNSSSGNTTNKSCSSNNIGGVISVLQKPKNTGPINSTSELISNLKLNEKASENSDGTVTCSYCAITFQDKNELRQHCQTETHQNVIMSDEGRDWKWRPPPRGYTIDSYSLCESFSESQSCHYGNQCVEAHGLDELNEWKERFEYRKMRLQKACEKELYGKSYTEELLEKWGQASSPDKVMCEKIDGVEEQCSNELVTSMSSKVSKREWVFILKSRKYLKAVALLQDAHRNHFSIKSICPGENKINFINSNKKSNNPVSKNTSNEVELKSDQEWISTTFDKTFLNPTKFSEILEHKIKITFNTEIFGTFRQSVCFDFGTEPVLVKHLCVDVLPVGDAEKIQEIKKDIISSAAQRWDETNCNLVKFETTIGSHLKTDSYLHDQKLEKELLERYPCPRAATFTLTQSTIIEKRLTKNNYRSRIHELLYVEEIARYEQVARYNLTTKLRITSSYMLTPSGMATSTAKYSHSGELFGLMTLDKDISEDTSAGRLILSNCLSVYLSPTPKDEHLKKKRDVFEALIEDKGKNMMYLKLSAKCVQGMTLKSDTDVQVDIQFQLNRLSYCEWHNAVDKITDFKIIFPDTFIEPNIPWTPKKQWSEICDPKLNAKQKEAVNAITTPINCSLPPILLIGPFGTGKTFTLAQAIKQLLTQPESRILICTHSNSAADLYIKEYLHPWVEKGMKEAVPLRVYYHKRWVATVNQVVQKYCIIDPSSGNFRRPSVEDIVKHRIVVVTLNISMQLALLGLPKGFFTHIFLDEAAQAMECEAIMPLALAGENTRIVLAGDHMQMSPELFSNFAKERRLHISLLERLYDHYPSNFPCKILLCENYRAHEAIIRFTSELFYEQKLIASGKQPRHDRFYPLTFFTTRGEDVQDKNSTAFYNNSEVYEVVERVCELRKKWPSSWGKINDSSIGIMTPYADQVFRIRSELRKRRMPGISVERVLNVQGKQFRAVFLSTVRTRRTCLPSNSLNNNIINTDDADYGFLSNSKLLNTAITRAQSLVAVVGDPVALCSIGRCRKVWERFIDICNQNKSLFGITWSFLRSQLDGVELKRSYILNPLAPEFIPRALQPEAYLSKQAAMYLMSSGTVSGVQPSHPIQQQQQNHHYQQQQQHHHHHHHSMHSQPAQQQNNQISSIYGSSHHYGMINQNNVSIPSQQHIPQKGSHQQLNSNSHQMPIRPPPNAGQPPPQQGYNLHGPQNNINNAQQYSSYMMWSQQQQQQQQQHSTNQMIRPNYPPPQHPSQSQPQSIHSTHPVTNQQNQGNNPNASLWGPPPQNNPWVGPKTSVNQPPNMRGPPGLNNTGAVMPPTTTPLGQNSAPQPINMNLNIRPNGNSAGPPMLGPSQQNSSHLSSVSSGTSSNQANSLRNSHDINAMTKYMYQNSSNHIGPSSSFQNNQNSLVINQLRNQLQTHQQSNGPASPAAMQAAAVALLAAQQQQQHQQQNHLDNLLRPNHINQAGNSIVGNSILNKEKDYQFLNNVHNIPINLNNTTAQIPNQHLHQQNLPQYHDYSFLLPPNMNFYDMAFEAKESQYKWYLRLLEMHGQEAANKFTEILKQVMCYTHNRTNSIPAVTSSASSNNFVNQRPTGLMNTSNMGTHGTSIVNNSNNSSTINTNDSSNPNFYQQIDLVFNSLMNGNEISQPILRDLLGMTGSDSNNQNNSVNTSIPSIKSYAQPQSILQQNQKNSGIPAYSNNINYLVNGTELGLSASREQSVPLYRRHALGSSNSSGIAGSNSSTSSIGTISNNSSSSTDYHSSTSSNNQSISSSTPDNLLESNNLASCGNNLAAGSNLYEALFNSTDISPYNNVNSIQKLFYNYSFKNECDLLLANNVSASAQTRNTLTVSNQLQHQNQQSHQPQQQQQQQQQQQHQQQHQQQQQQQQQHHNQSQPLSHPPQQHTTYAAVLSQGAVATQQPQQSSQQTSQQQQNHNNTNNTASEEKDPFAAIRELGQRSNGFYNYFQ